MKRGCLSAIYGPVELLTPPCGRRYNFCAYVLCKLAEDPLLRQEYGRNTRRLAEESFFRDKLASEFVDWLENVYRRWKQ